MSVILFWEMAEESACVNFGVRMHIVFRKSSIKISRDLHCKPCADL